MGAVLDLVKVLYDPGAVFTRVGERPRFLAPFVGLAVVQMILAYLALPYAQAAMHAMLAQAHPPGRERARPREVCDPGRDLRADRTPDRPPDLDGAVVGARVARRRGSEVRHAAVDRDLRGGDEHPAGHRRRGGVDAQGRRRRHVAGGSAAGDVT